MVDLVIYTLLNLVHIPMVIKVMAEVEEVEEMVLDIALVVVAGV
jgi:hypothetical protein